MIIDFFNLIFMEIVAVFCHVHALACRKYVATVGVVARDDLLGASLHANPSPQLGDCAVRIHGQEGSGQRQERGAVYRSCSEER